MQFQDFYREMIPLGIVNHHQVIAWNPKFDKNNFGRWVKKGWLIKLKNGFYTFPELVHEPDFAFYIANRIYRPSYISLHSALAFYGLIPEAVLQITSVSARKTATFENVVGTFTYLSMKPEAMFGYDRLAFQQNKSILIAQPEKALLDLLYLYPFYSNGDELENLRLDVQVLDEIIDMKTLIEYAHRFNNHALVNRINILKHIYHL